MTFLQGENPVVSCGFGSMGTADPVHLTEMVMAAADWGMRVHQLGIGPVPIPPTRLDQKSLKQTLQIVLDNQQMQIKARAFGQIVMAEEGITNAVQVFDQLVLPPK